MTADPETYVAAGGGDWTQPGVEAVAPGVFRIPLPMPGEALKAVNVYALEQADGFTLIDGGWAIAAARTQLEKSLTQIGAQLRSIRRILVTHAHNDHYTLAVILRREFGLPIGLGWGERASIAALTSPNPQRAFQSQLDLLNAAGASELSRSFERQKRFVNPRTDGWETPDTWLQPGVVTVGESELTIVATPGHTRGHVVFADTGRGLLFSGDHLLPHITPSIGLETVASPSPLKSFLESLAVVRRLPDLRLLPAHGPVSPSSHQRVDELVDHHDARLAETRAILADGPAIALEVARRLTWTRRRRAFSELDDFNQMLAIGETIAHLKVLIQSGSAAGDDVDGLIVYSLASRERDQLNSRAARSSGG